MTTRISSFNSIAHTCIYSGSPDTIGWLSSSERLRDAVLRIVKLSSDAYAISSVAPQSSNGVLSYGGVYVDI